MSKDPNNLHRRKNARESRGERHFHKVQSGFHHSRDEIDYLRSGGWTRPSQAGLEAMTPPGSYRTYGGSDNQNGDSDYDSAYGDDEKLYNDPAAQERFLSGKDDNGG